MSTNNINRRKSYEVKVGNISVGGDNPVVVQSMTDTDTSDIDKTTKVKLMTKGKSFSLENTSVIKKPMDWSKDAWHKDERAAINRNGQTDLSLNDNLEIMFSGFSLSDILYGKVT